MKILDGKKVAEIESLKLKNIVSSLPKKPSLAIIQVGNLEESNKYINNKIKKANELGITTQHIKFDENIKENEIINYINQINPKYDGIIVQLPLPSNLNKKRILDSIDTSKDVDWCNSINLSKFYNDDNPLFIPATARAIKILLDFYEIDIKNKKILVIGESDLVGKPTKKLLSYFSSHVDSTNKKIGISHANDYDVLIVAAGSPKLIKKNNVKNQAIIIDVGLTIQDNKMYGDVDFEDVKDIVQAISPVPGGVGPLTVICLMKNLVEKLL